MKKKELFPLAFIFTVFMSMLMISACSSRNKIPVTNTDSTIVFPAKNADGISVKINFCRKVDKLTGKQIGAGKVFTIMEKEVIRAFVDIENRFYYGDKQLMFHFDWVGTDGRSIYKKRVDLSPTDSSNTINSSISISPDVRQAGEYTLRLYFFRELIAEKKFELLPKFQFSPFKNDKTKVNITLCRKADKNTGKLIGVDTVFMIREKRNVRAFFNLEDPLVYGNRELLFRFDWAKTDSMPFYRKRVNISPTDSSLTINSSISITPEKRQAGKYTVRLYLFNELMEEKNFELRPELQLTATQAKKIKTNITLFRKVSKKTGKRIGKGTVFTIKEKRRVRASIDLENRFAFGNQELIFHIYWIGPDHKSIYRKQINLFPGNSSSVINSSISIAPGKRQPGVYFLRLYLFNKLIKEKKFELRPES